MAESNNDPRVRQYISGFPKEAREKLEELQAAIYEIVPEAVEKISYGIPTFTLDGKYFIYIGGWKEHVSIYPIPLGDDKFISEIEPYVAGKGTLRFPIDKPLPISLIRKIIKLAIKRRQLRAGK